MSTPHDDPPPEPVTPSAASGDHDATNYNATPPADPAATRYAGAPLGDPTPPQPGDPDSALGTTTPADPHATAYTPTSGGPAMPTLLPRPFGGYELLEELGHGGMGVVYKARQSAPERLVALKLIRSGQLAAQEDVRRFQQEANEAARLDHPNIVPVYEVGEHDGLHFFTMKMVEGGGLDKRLERYQNDMKATAQLVATAAWAVHYAHQRQLLHRDLKPGNILLDAAGQPHVADFGLAKRMGGAGEASQSAGAGTPEFMAPEQARGDARLTTAADVYGLGGVLYALLAGRPPFHGTSPWAAMQKVLTEEPAPPSMVRPGVPRDLETICLKCLSKEPARRYASAEALAEDLERWLRGEPVRARPVGRLERAWLWSRRNRAAAVLSTAFVTALLLGAGVSTYFAVESNGNYQKARRREKDANDALGTVSDQKEQLSKANAQLQETLARSFLRPLGNDGGVTDPGIEALWDLTVSGDRVRLLFVEQALQRPLTTRQLFNCADLGVHAAVGLDTAKRRQVEQILLSRLRDGNADFEIRAECMAIGVALDEWSPEFVSTAAGPPVEAMGKTTIPFTLDMLTGTRAEAVAALAPRMESGDASVAFRRTVEAIAKTNDLHALVSLARALAALAPRLEPADASAAFRTVEAMCPSEPVGGSRPLIGGQLLEVLAALAPRLEPADASAAARRTVEAMGRTTDRFALSFLSMALAALAPRLEPADASAAARQVMQMIMSRSNALDNLALSSLARAAAALAPRLEPGDASAVARQVVEAMAMTILQLKALDSLAEVLAALAPRLESADASVAARRTLEAIGRTDSLKPGEALAALAARLEPGDASAVARQVVEAMAMTNSRFSMSSLAETLAALAPRMEPGDASASARQVVDVMAKTFVSPPRVSIGGWGIGWRGR